MNRKNTALITGLLTLTVLLNACAYQIVQQPAEEAGTQQEAIAEALPAGDAAEQAEEAYATIEAGIQQVKKYGNIVLTISPESMKELGFEEADLITVTAGSNSLDMPIGTSFSDVDAGQAVCRYQYLENTDTPSNVALAVNTGNFISALGLAEIETIEEAPGYRLLWNEGFDENTTLLISMKEKQGYAEQYAVRKVTENRSNNREDYPELSDAEYANFREVATSGMGTGILYRSSSPVYPKLNRNKEADEALYLADVKTIINMADTADAAASFEDYGYSHYSQCDIIGLNMGLDIYAEDFQNKLAEGFRFMISQDGPYLIHCNEGKDRTGFACAILEALTGASAEEIVSDYMVTYHNFYGIEPGTDTYSMVAETNIEKTLQNTFHIDSIYEAPDLASCAQEYLLGIGMTGEEIEQLKERLTANAAEE